MLVKIPEKGGGRNKNRGHKDNGLFPVFPNQSLFRKQEADQKYYENSRRDAESDVGVETDAENQSRQEEVPIMFGAQAAEKEIKRKNQDGRKHDRAETDAGKIYCPKRKSGQIGGDEACPPAAAEKFLGKQEYPKDGQSSENNGPNFESEHRGAENFERKGDEIQE